MNDEWTDVMDDLAAAVTRLEVMVGELQLRRRDLWQAADPTARTRIESAILMQSLSIRSYQVDCWMRGLSVFITYDRNGLPIRVTRSKENIVG